MAIAKIICAVGTRPEAIKMAPIILALRSESWANVCVLVTAQHRTLLDQVLNFFAIEADIDLDIMRPNQQLSSLTANLLLRLDAVLETQNPDLLLAQGDTTTVMAAALACFYRRVPFGHIEAGLRTGNLENPFPEELNRVMAGRLARWHFAPTEGSRENLMREGVRNEDIVVAGNTVIDALMMAVSKEPDIGVRVDGSKRLLLVTAHRRENFGAPLRSIFRALQIVANRNPDIQILYPVHPNPNVKNLALEMLGPIPGIFLCDPLDYGPFVAAMKRSYFILSDSGGVQEEAPALGKPVLVLRDETERPEAVQEGVVKLVGCDCDRIVREVQLLLDDQLAYQKMARGVSPYGDGQSAVRIVRKLRAIFA